VNARRYLVRLFSSGIPKWFEDAPDIDDLAKKAFDLADGEQSVYEVADGEEECLAVAAHKLADPRKSPDAVSVLRIDRRDLPCFGIRVDEGQFGTTGIPRWDCRHRNLLANRGQLIEFVRFMAGRCHRGHDQVRRIEKLLVVRTLNAICGYSPCHCPNHVKLIAQWCQSNKGARPSLSLDQIEREVAAVEFEDEAIRPGAERLSSGDQKGDWYSSLKALRGSYAGPSQIHGIGCLSVCTQSFPWLTAALPWRGICHSPEAGKDAIKVRRGGPGRRPARRRMCVSPRNAIHFNFRLPAGAGDRKVGRHSMCE